MDLDTLTTEELETLIRLLEKAVAEGMGYRPGLEAMLDAAISESDARE